MLTAHALIRTGQGLMYLGKVRAHQGRHAECLDLYLKALAQYDSTIGSKHFRVAALYKSIGTTHIDLKQYQDAWYVAVRVCS